MTRHFLHIRRLMRQLTVRTSFSREVGLKLESAGFTLIELLVVTAIIVVVSGVVLANQNRFGGQVLLQSFAYDVALSVRQAQVYGLAVKRSGTTFGSSYGIHFEIDNPTTTTINESMMYDLFTDLDKNGVESSTEKVQTMNIKRGYVVSDLCVAPGAAACVSGSKRVDIIFQRPEPDAKISWVDANDVAHNCFSPSPECAVSATIRLKSPRGDTMAVTVDNNGQITVVKP